MTRSNQRALHSGSKGVNTAMDLVRRMADQWKNGKPLRQVRKVLRKNGIHCWSLLAMLRGDPWVRMIQALNAPRWLLDASRMDYSAFGGHGYVEGFRFFNVGDEFRLPEGLVTPKLEISNAPHLRRLPRRLWTHQIQLTDCPLLEFLPERPAHPEMFYMKRCHRICRIPEAMTPLVSMDLDDCSAMRQLPKLPKYGWEGLPRRLDKGERDHIRLKNLPNLKGFSGPESIMHLLIWHCPSLERLDRVKVRYRLDLHDCAALETLPDCSNEIDHVAVSDCPQLKVPELPLLNVSLQFNPMEGPSRLPALAPIPRIQEVTTLMLSEETRPALKEPWPWPPGPHRSPSLDPGIQRTLRILGIELYDQVYALAALGNDMRAVLREQLLTGSNPSQAMKLATNLLEAAARKADLTLPNLLMLEAEALGLGGLSGALNLRLQDLIAIDNAIHSTWPTAFCRTNNPVYFLDSLEVMEGPLVVHRHELDCYERRGLRELHGPLWSDHRTRFSECPHLEILPDLMVVQSDLDVSDCESLWRFPRRLDVKGNLTIRNLPRLRAQRCVARVGGQVRVEGTPGLTIVQVDRP